MDEQTQEKQEESKETQSEESEETSETSSEEQKASEESEVDALSQARELVERQEKANLKTEQLIKEQKKLIADDIVRGRSLAGGPQQKKEMTHKEYAQALMEGKIKPKDE